MPPAALLDVDGTLIDTNYHHAVAWYRAFRAQGLTLPLWRIHRAVGMGGDQLVPELIGEEVDRERGDEIREARSLIYQQLIEEVAPLEGARELIVALKKHGSRVVLASSSPQQEIDRYLDLLAARDLADAWTTDDDVDATKPEPDLVQAALEKAGTGDAVMVGDTPWDIEAARRAGLDTICVLTGGWTEHDLHEAGAVAVYESVDQLRRKLDETLFTRSN
jgi:HAD superfamily hydrolase (TIGR01509 family)